jgi:hypothetical protein
MRLLPVIVALSAVDIVSAAHAFQFTATAGSNGFKMTIVGKCASKDCSIGTVRAWQECNPEKDQNCPVSATGTFTRKGNCYDLNYTWVMKNGDRYPRQHYYTADGGLCSV